MTERRRRLGVPEGTIKYYKPSYSLDDFNIGDFITFRWHKRWQIIGKTKSSFILKKVSDKFIKPKPHKPHKLTKKEKKFVRKIYQQWAHRKIQEARLKRRGIKVKPQPTFELIPATTPHIKRRKKM